MLRGSEVLVLWSVGVHRSGGLPQAFARPYDVLLRGMATEAQGVWAERAWLFIALCRSIKVPARTVWVPQHCYPEFYLVDESGKGQWFPCQVAGAASFGKIDETRPILLKGDNFKDPERPRERFRFVPEFVKGAGSKGGGTPKVQFVRDTAGL